ncbi:MAG: hypothetical protein IPJ65_09310 [Archangiaceae bacterium]|nr:hypothetical protein [Archangiaceae bacterium]
MIRAAAGLLGLVSLAACSSGPSAIDAGTDAGTGLTPVETCDLLAAAKCGLDARCYAAFDRDATEDCRTLQQSRCLAEYQALKPSFDAEKVKIDSSKVRECEARMNGSSCPPSFPPDYFALAAHPFSDCSWQTGLLIGQVKSGDTCDNGVECAPGVVCVKQGGVCLGTCSSYSVEGEPCAFGCAAGLRCDDQGDQDPNNDVCRPVRLLNEACRSSAECEPSLVCNVTCRPRGKEGEACRFDLDRLSTCDPGLACDVVPYVENQVGTCLRPKDAFEACRFHWSCKPGLVCADIDWTGFPNTSPGVGSCRPPSGVDANCLPTIYSAYVGDPCAPGSYCSTTTRKCTVIPKLGEACDPSSVCAGVGVYCKPTGGDLGTCTGPASQGDRCAFSIDTTRTVTIPCSSGFCDTESTLSCRAPFRPLNDACKEDGECTTGRCAVQQDRTLRCADACN